MEAQGRVDLEHQIGGDSTDKGADPLHRAKTRELLEETRRRVYELPAGGYSPRKRG